MDGDLDVYATFSVGALKGGTGDAQNFGGLLTSWVVGDERDVASPLRHGYWSMRMSPVPVAANWAQIHTLRSSRSTKVLVALPPAVNVLWRGPPRPTTQCVEVCIDALESFQIGSISPCM